MAKRLQAARNPEDIDERGQHPFVKIEVDYRKLHENQVTFVDKFHCSVNDSVVSIDSDYLINFGWAMSNIRPLFENKMSRVHPIFMKESIYEQRDLAIEHLNKGDTFSDLHDGT